MAHSWWLLNITANNGSANVAIGEVEMHSIVGGADLCNGGTADASSHLVGYEPSKAFNDTAATFWVAAAATGALRYQFPAPVNVVELVITSRGDGYTGDAPKDFSLQYSDNGADWVDSGIAVTGATGWGIGESRTYALPTPPAPDGWALATLYKKIDGVFTEVSFADRTSGVLEELYVRSAENWTDITDSSFWDTQYTGGIFDGATHTWTTRQYGENGGVLLEDGYSPEGYPSTWTVGVRFSKIRVTYNGCPDAVLSIYDYDGNDLMVLPGGAMRHFASGEEIPVSFGAFDFCALRICGWSSSTPQSGTFVPINVTKIEIYTADAIPATGPYPSGSRT